MVIYLSHQNEPTTTDTTLLLLLLLQIYNYNHYYYSCSLLIHREGSYLLGCQLGIINEKNPTYH